MELQVQYDWNMMCEICNNSNVIPRIWLSVQEVRSIMFRKCSMTKIAERYSFILIIYQCISKLKEVLFHPQSTINKDLVITPRIRIIITSN